MTAPDRSPPHSQEAEEHVIACCLLDGGDTLNSTIDRGLVPESFYFPANRLIYEILLRLRAQSKPIGIETLAEELKNSRQLEAVGGFGYLMQVTGKIPTTTHANYFCDQVRSKAQLRELIKTATSAVEQAYSANGDNAELMESVRHGIEEVTRPALAGLNSRAFDPKKQHPKPKPVFTAAGTTICTPGNLTTLYSPPKAGKSSLLGAMLASTMLPPGDQSHDCLGMSGPNPNGHAVVHLDTEQSPYDWQQMIQTALRRAGEKEPPKWLLSYSLTGLSAPECRRALETILRQAKRRFGGIHSVHIDGIGDLVTDPNDPAECFPLITNLHALAIEYQTAIINVLHLNPGSEEKGRGHLGSQLERKSESNLMLEKKDGVSSYWGTKQRGKAISKSEAPSFQWSEEKQMHISCATVEQPKKAGGRTKLHSIHEFWDCLPKPGQKPMTGAQLHRFATQIREIKLTTFKDLLADAAKDGTLTRTYDDKTGYAYVVSGPAPAPEVKTPIELPPWDGD